MVKMKDSYYEPIEKDINYYFYKFYWEEIFKILEEDKKQLVNSKSALISAIRSGKVHYKSGVFTGTYNSKISKELSEFAKYNKKTKKWEGLAPQEIQAAATVANSKGETLNNKIKAAIEKIPARVKELVDKLKYSITGTLDSISKDAEKELNSLGISVEMTPELSQRLSDNYTNNQNINIKNWTEVEITRLRDVVEKNVLSGFNRNELKDLIINEYGVSQNKAKFLARQETSLFLAEVRDERFQSAGITKFKWSSSHDGRVRDEHNELNGQIFSYSDLPIIDKRTGERGVPGQAFGCRCMAIPVID